MFAGKYVLCLGVRGGGGWRSRRLQGRGWLLSASSAFFLVMGLGYGITSPFGPIAWVVGQLSFEKLQQCGVFSGHVRSTGTTGRSRRAPPPRCPQQQPHQALQRTPPLDKSPLLNFAAPPRSARSPPPVCRPPPPQADSWRFARWSRCRPERTCACTTSISSKARPRDEESSSRPSTSCASAPGELLTPTYLPVYHTCTGPPSLPFFLCRAARAGRCRCEARKR